MIKIVIETKPIPYIEERILFQKEYQGNNKSQCITRFKKSFGEQFTNAGINAFTIEEDGKKTKFSLTDEQLDIFGGEK